MKQVFPIIPASSGPFWLLGVVGVFLLALLFLFAYLAYSSRNVKFEVSAKGLRIKGDQIFVNPPESFLDTLKEIMTKACQPGTPVCI